MKWQDRIPDTEVLECCNILGIEALLMRLQFRWCSHVSRMADDCIPRQLLYGQLVNVKRSRGGQRKRFKDKLRINLQACTMDSKTWGTLAADRVTWHDLCKEKTELFEANRLETTSYVCDICGRMCLSCIGLVSHHRSHH